MNLQAMDPKRMLHKHVIKAPYTGFEFLVVLLGTMLDTCIKLIPLRNLHAESPE
jgi:hypothetical protein